jgi:hypothetical protein
MFGAPMDPANSNDEAIREGDPPYRPGFREGKHAQASSDACNDSAIALRLLVITATAIACVGGGATAGVAAFVSEFRWPLSDANFDYSCRLGTYGGIVGALLAAFCLSQVKRRYLWTTAVVALGATWFVTCAGVWWHMVSGLG